MLNKNVTVSFYDCCLPDYFCGHHQPVLQCPVDGATTRKQLYDGLLSELNMGVIDYQMKQNNLDYDAIRQAIFNCLFDYDAIRQAIFNCLFFKPECKDNDILFSESEIWAEEDEIEPCYAFFVVRWEEEESE